MKGPKLPRYILLVDDNEMLRASIEEYLNEIGYLVMTAGNGLEAIEILDRMDEQIGLLITDLHMPILDGISLIRHVRQFDTELPIVVISGYAENTEMGQIADLQVTRFDKPLDFNVLEQKLKHLWPKR